MSDPRRRSARQSSGDVSESPPVSKHPADAPIDASSMPWYALTRYWENQRNDCELMSRLDFVNLPDERIIRLFAQKESTTIKELIKELLPPARRRTGAQIREFVRVSKEGKKDLHNKYANYRIDTTSSISYHEYVEEQNQNAKVEKANTANVATVKDSSDGNDTSEGQILVVQGLMLLHILDLYQREGVSSRN